MIDNAKRAVAMKMTERPYTVRFLTPAFLGDAQQNARWRTPPIKHELRHWWRVVYAADHGFRVRVEDMRREEGLLFGNAWLDGDFRKSLVRLRLERWDKGKLTSWMGLEQGTVFHPEVQRTGFKVGPHAYLGYGPLDGRGNTNLSEKINAAIQAGEVATLSLAYPTTHDDTELKKLLEANIPRLEQAYVLMHRYGTLGGRSRNGWGSYHLLPSPSGRGDGGEGLPLRDWRDCLELDWPHAIGKDEKGALIWQTAEHEDWKSLMRTLAIVKIGLRTQFAFPNAKPPHAGIELRHWLSYPITTHTTRAWDRGARLPNQIRFKARQTANGKLVGVIFHMPHLPPPAFKPDRAAIEKVWRCVHKFLDALTEEPKQRKFCKDADHTALQKQAPQLDSVRLHRIPE
ncbi:MAG: hypothetical protein KatS3mg123_2307 [Burkholderiales bacterium]|nr:MAG: hypothetical protein KatS3mg123_2307 [Burkholderiales bacterium]